MERNRSIRREEAKEKWRKSGKCIKIFFGRRRKISFVEFWRKKYVK